MPLSGPLNGFMERLKGRSYVPSSAYQQFGKGAATSLGGGNLAVFVNGANGNGNSADTTEDVLFTGNLPLNSLDVVGRQVFIEAYGNIAATSATKNARVYFGSTVLVNFAATTTQTGVWAVQALITKVGSSAQSALVLTDTTISGSLVRAVSILSPTESDTAAITIKATGQSSVGTANLVTCVGLTIGGYN